MDSNKAKVIIIGMVFGFAFLLAALIILLEIVRVIHA
jgi:hypothetical protein